MAMRFLEASVGNYLWVRTIIRHDTISKSHFCESATTSARISPLHLRDIWDDHQSRWLCLRNVPLLLYGPPPQKKKSHLSLIETHCFLMVGNRDKGEGGHTWAQCRHVGIHQLTSTECPHICRRFERKRRQEARSPPTISERHLQQSLYSNRPGAVPQPNQWHLSALWKKPIMGWGSAGSERRRGRC